MEVQTHDWPTVALVDVVLVQTGFRPSTIIPVGLVNVAFFRTDQESRCFVVWEVKCGDGYLPCFVVTSVDEFQGFLPRIKTDKRTKCRGTLPGAEPAYQPTNYTPARLYCS